MAALLLGAATGATWSAFSSATSSGGSTFSAAASFAPQLVQELGTTSCGGASSSVAVTGPGTTAGNMVVVTLALRGAVAGPVAVADSRGNTYTQDADVTNGAVRTLVFSARLDAALVAGDTITASHPFSDDAQAMAAAEFSGIASGGRVDTAGNATGMSDTPGAGVTTLNSDDVLVAATVNQNTRAHTDNADWTQLAHMETNCGGGPGRMTLHSAYRIVSSPGAWPYGATLSAPERWGTAVIAYRG